MTLPNVLSITALQTASKMMQSYCRTLRVRRFDAEVVSDAD